MFFFSNTIILVKRMSATLHWWFLHANNSRSKKAFTKLPKSGVISRLKHCKLRQTFLFFRISSFFIKIFSIKSDEKFSWKFFNLFFFFKFNFWIYQFSRVFFQSLCQSASGSRRQRGSKACRVGRAKDVRMILFANFRMARRDEKCFIFLPP